MPTPQPTPYPTVSPTPAPTCTPKTLDVCIAIDESGSICSFPGTPQLCLNGLCTATECTGSAGGVSGNCDYANDCPRFNDVDVAIPNVKNFTTTFITEVENDLDSLGTKVTAQYSIVEFASDAVITAGLPTLVDDVAAKAAVNSIAYSGGFTNLEQAILKCNATLKESTADLKAMVLVTDGLATVNGDPPTGFPSAEPGGPNSAAAVVAATAAKDAGIDIATVYILGGSTGFFPSAGSTFLEDHIASSPDLGFEDVSFPDAKDLADKILDGIDPCTSDP